MLRVHFSRFYHSCKSTQPIVVDHQSETLDVGHILRLKGVRYGHKREPWQVSDFVNRRVTRKRYDDHTKSWIPTQTQRITDAVRLQSLRDGRFEIVSLKDLKAANDHTFQEPRPAA